MHPALPTDPYDDDIRPLLRRAGDLLAQRLTDAGAGPVCRFEPPGRVARGFADPAPSRGRPVAVVWRRLRDALDRGVNLHHPAYLGHQVAPPLPLAAAAEAVSAFANQGMAAWELSPTATMIDRQVARWFCDAAGYGPASGGIFVSGGTMANLLGLLAARNREPGAWTRGVDARRRLRIFCSDQAHYSVSRAAGILGLGSDAVVPVRSDAAYRIDPQALRDALRSARRRGESAMAIVATAGTTATGSFDPLPECASLARGNGAWFHVDGAHGASFLLSRRLRGLLAGVARADSLAWDPHKMLFLPMSTSTVLFRRARDMDRLFRQDAPYIFGTAADVPAELNLGERTFQCSRAWDSLKVWLAFLRHGTAAFARMMEATCEGARTLARLLSETDGFEIPHEPACNILCFRARPPGIAGAALDRFNLALRNRLNRSGEAWLTTTVLRGRRVLRAVVMNPCTGRADLEGVVRSLCAHARALAGGMGRVSRRARRGSAARRRTGRRR